MWSQVTTPWQPGDGPRADAMVTDRPGIALGIITADCAPVLLADAGGRRRRRRPCRLARRGGRRARGDGRRHGRPRRRPARSSRRSDPASARPPTKSAPTCATPCWRRDAGNDALLRTGRREARWQFDLAGYCAARLAAAGVVRQCHRRRHRRRRGAVLQPPPPHAGAAAGRSATRFPSSRSIRDSHARRASCLLLLLCCSHRAATCRSRSCGNPGATARLLAQPPTPRLGGAAAGRRAAARRGQPAFADALAGGLPGAGGAGGRRGCTPATGGS